MCAHTGSQARAQAKNINKNRRRPGLLIRQNRSTGVSRLVRPEPLRTSDRNRISRLAGDIRRLGRRQQRAGDFMRVLAVVLCTLLLAACGSSEDTTDTTTGTTAISGDSGRITLGVNSYLWHATLDTLAFMPLQSADPYGGVIITEWYSAPQDPNERMKVTIYILDRRLRADGIKIAVFRQTRSADSWIDAQVNPETATKLEDAILTRARELRLASEGAGS